tara:strand:- start:106 stop:420 length:315 start_codon:yes stop_codon:yes gene_type:complete
MKKSLCIGLILLVLFSLSFNLISADDWDDWLAETEGDSDGEDSVIDSETSQQTTETQNIPQTPRKKFSFKDYEFTWRFYLIILLGLIVIGIIIFLIISLKKKLI